MNSLEREYRANLERTKERETRRFRGLVIAGAVSTVIATFGAFAVRRDVTLVDALWLTLIVVVFAAARYAPAALKQVEDRNVEVATTERERELGYRDSVVAHTDVQSVSFVVRVLARVPTLVWLLALVPVGVAMFLVGAINDRGMSSGVIPSRLEGAGITLAGIGLILSGKHIYATWRARRNARLELECERWLESADSCKVGARKWTK